MKLQDLCRAAGLDCPKDAGLLEISAVVTDSRRVTSGGLFVCIDGLHNDGHEFIDLAVKNGSVAVVVEAEHEFTASSDTVLLQAANTRQAAAMLYHAWYGFPTSRLHMIGVTGTNGKTSVSYLIRRILESAGCRCGLIGTVGCESLGRPLDSRSENRLANMTTPDPEVLYRLLSEMVRDGVEYVVMEVTSHALSLGKVAPICFDVGVFTNLTPEHLDFHQTMEAYAEAKAELFSKSRVAVINLDSPSSELMKKNAKGRVIGCSAACVADVYADEVTFSENGVAYAMHVGRESLRITCPIPGEFTLMNSMQAAIAALCMGVRTDCVQNALSDFCGVKGRMECVALPGADFRVWIDHAHTPDALERLLISARRIKKKNGRVVLLFGCGGDRDRSKRAAMGRIASQYADFVIVTSDNSRGEDPWQIVREICRGILPQTFHRVILDRHEAIRYAVLQAKPDDLILLAGKGHEEYEIIRDERRPFFERAIVQSAFAERAH